MGVWNIWDLTRRLDEDEFGQLIREVARVEARTRYEVLSQVLSLLYEAEKRGLGISGVKDIVADWLTYAEDLYIELVLKDPIYSAIKSRVEHISKKEVVEAPVPHT